MKLISMTDFVLVQDGTHKTNYSGAVRYNRCKKYANFLKQPLTLGMFVPCLGEKIIQWENEDPYVDTEHGRYFLELEQYQKAKDRILFEGGKLGIEKGVQMGIKFECDCIDIGCIKFYLSGLDQHTIEDMYLLQSECDEELIELTPTALKQLGLK